MKTQMLAIGIALILLVFGVPLAMFATAQVERVKKAPEKQGVDYKISGPYSYENLTIFLVHGKDKSRGKTPLTLQEAMERKVVIVYETKEVNELAVENVSSDEEVYIQSGEIVKGGQQDRMLGVDLILPPRSGKVPIAAFCVEHGRWQQRGREEAGKFNSSADQVATKDLKLAAKQKGDQGQVWSKVAEAQQKLSQSVGAPVQSSESSSSLQLTLENRSVQQTAENYINHLSRIVEGRSDVIGYAFAINGKVNSADVYASSGLFKKLWPKLLKASAIEAISELQKGRQFSPATADGINAFIDDAEKGQASEKDVTRRTKMVTRETDKNIFFETRDLAKEDAWVHRNYINK